MNYTPQIFYGIPGGATQCINHIIMTEKSIHHISKFKL